MSEGTTSAGTWTVWGDQRQPLFVNLDRATMKGCIDNDWTSALWAENTDTGERYTGVEKYMVLFPNCLPNPTGKYHVVTYTDWFSRKDTQEPVPFLSDHDTYLEADTAREAANSTISPD
jgi:hypothetical protein